jgi:hypothetical protein
LTEGLALTAVPCHFGLADRPPFRKVGEDLDNLVEATLEGYLDFPTDRSGIGTLRLVTDKATFDAPSRHFGVAVRSVAAPAEEGMATTYRAKLEPSKRDPRLREVVEEIERNCLPRQT